MVTKKKLNNYCILGLNEKQSIETSLARFERDFYCFHDIIIKGIVQAPKEVIQMYDDIVKLTFNKTELYQFISLIENEIRFDKIIKFIKKFNRIMGFKNNIRSRAESNLGLIEMSYYFAKQYFDKKGVGLIYEYNPFYNIIFIYRWLKDNTPKEKVILSIPEKALAESIIAMYPRDFVINNAKLKELRHNYDKQLILLFYCPIILN